MKTHVLSLSAAMILTLGCPLVAPAQGIPTKQPSLLTIVREEIKPGRSEEHAKHEQGWPAAYAKAKSPYNYLALTSLTGTGEALYVVPFESNAAVADSMKRDDADPVLSAELARLSRIDSEYLTGSRVIQAVARNDLSMGSFPDIPSMRFYQITFFRVRPGHDSEFETAAKTYHAAATRLGRDPQVRVYQVIAGMPSPTYVLFTSVGDYAEFDKVTADGQAVWTGMNAEESSIMAKFGKEGLINTETNRFRVDPKQSYVDKETAAKFPDFWTSY